MQDTSSTWQCVYSSLDATLRDNFAEETETCLLGNVKTKGVRGSSVVAMADSKPLRRSPQSHVNNIANRFFWSIIPVKTLSFIYMLLVDRLGAKAQHCTTQRLELGSLIFAHGVTPDALCSMSIGTPIRYLSTIRLTPGKRCYSLLCRQILIPWLHNLVITMRTRHHSELLNQDL